MNFDYKDEFLELSVEEIFNLNFLVIKAFLVSCIIRIWCLCTFEAMQ